MNEKGLSEIRFLKILPDNLLLVSSQKPRIMIKILCFTSGFIARFG
jgi:hypothetical protein